VELITHNCKSKLQLQVENSIYPRCAIHRRQQGNSLSASATITIHKIVHLLTQVQLFLVPCPHHQPPQCCLMHTSLIPAQSRMSFYRPLSYRSRKLSIKTNTTWYLTSTFRTLWCHSLRRKQNCQLLLGASMTRRSNKLRIMLLLLCTKTGHYRTHKNSTAQISCSNR
jgi:hypothetical protein